jgi:hypothetical protein
MKKPPPGWDTGPLRKVSALGATDGSRKFRRRSRSWALSAFHFVSRALMSSAISTTTEAASTASTFS